MLLGCLLGNVQAWLTHAVAQWAVGLPFHILAGRRTVCPARDVSKPHPCPSPRRRGEPELELSSVTIQPMVALALPSQGRVAEGREGFGAASIDEADTRAHIDEAIAHPTPAAAIPVEVHLG